MRYAKTYIEFIITSNYLEHIKKGNQEKTFYEIVVQIGNMKDFGVNMRTAEIAKTILDEYMKSFQDRNPYLYVFSAVCLLMHSLVLVGY